MQNQIFLKKIDIQININYRLQSKLNRVENFTIIKLTQTMSIQRINKTVEKKGKLLCTSGIS